MNRFYFLILSSLFFACSSEPKIKEVKESVPDSFDESSQNKIDSSLLQANQNNNDTLETNSNCSPEFLKEFNASKKSGGTRVYIKGNKIYNEKEVMAEFPDYPKKGQTVTFTGKKDQLDITLKLKRINYTSLEYNLDLSESGQIIYSDKGEASIHGSFYFGAESFINPEDPESLIFGEQYINNKNSFSVLIGDIEDVKTRYLQISEYYLAKINKKYKENFPLLTEK